MHIQSAFVRELSELNRGIVSERVAGTVAECLPRLRGLLHVHSGFINAIAARGLKMSVAIRP